MSIILLLTVLTQCCIIVYMARCPNCNREVESTAIVAAFNDPPGWVFWGEPGARIIIPLEEAERVISQLPQGEIIESA